VVDANDLTVEGEPIADWRDLHARAARTLRECGMDAHADQQVITPAAVIVVVAHDRSRTPEAISICKSKHWRARSHEMPFPAYGKW
jgi:hypothetical protein